MSPRSMPSMPMSVEINALSNDMPRRPFSISTCKYNALPAAAFASALASASEVVASELTLAPDAIAAS